MSIAFGVFPWTSVDDEHVIEINTYILRPLEVCCSGCCGINNKKQYDFMTDLSNN